MFNIIQSTLAGAKWVFEILDYEEKTADEEDSLEKIKDSVGEVAFHPVSFQVKPGEVIALPGETGAGKTTIVNLLTHFMMWTDLELLQGGGYQVAEVQSVDMFPWARHVETVILMTNSGSKGK